MEQSLRVIYTCFPEGKHKVLTMSYDDGRLEDRRLLEIMNAYGIRGPSHLTITYSNIILHEMQAFFRRLKTFML